MFQRLLWCISLYVLLCICSPGLSLAQDNILFVLDASGSMWGRVDGTIKMETAKQTLGKLLPDIPAETNVGILIYGLFLEKSCDDAHLVVGVGQKNSHEEVKKWINKAQPKGKTPIAKALRLGGDHLTAYKADRNYMILISDGIETCDGDPCQVAEVLAEKEINLKIHVVGFNVDEKAREQLKCIAKAGKGLYFNADSTAGFIEAITAVKKEVVAVEPEPAKPVEYFRDNFDGDDLAEHWEVLNPNPDTFTLEDGRLVVLSSGTADISDENVENTFILNKDMPDGNWDAVVKLIPDIQTFQESVSLSYMKDGKNRLTATVDFYGTVRHAHRQHLKLLGQKFSKGNMTKFQTEALMSQSPAEDLPSQLAWCKNNVRAIYLKIAKRGRSYVVSTKIEGDATTKDGKKPEWVSLQKLTSMRPPGNNLVLSFPQRTKTNGESIISVDWVKIEVPANAE